VCAEQMVSDVTQVTAKRACSARFKPLKVLVDFLFQYGGVSEVFVVCKIINRFNCYG
jgi:hypothetical protein